MDEKDIQFLRTLFASEATRNRFAKIFDKRINKLSDLKFLKNWIKENDNHNKGPTVEMVFYAADLSTTLLEEFKNDILHFKSSDKEPSKKSDIPI